MKSRTQMLSVVLALAALTAGCSTFAIRPPTGFAQLQHQAPQFDFRAVSAYGVAIGVRVVPNRERANLDFWSEALDRHFQSTGPYHAAGSTDVRTANGLAGRRLAYTFGDAQSGNTYWLTVFVTDKRVFVVEAGGGIDAFTRARPAIEAAIRSFRTA